MPGYAQATILGDIELCRSQIVDGYNGYPGGIGLDLLVGDGDVSIAGGSPIGYQRLLSSRMIGAPVSLSRSSIRSGL